MTHTHHPRQEGQVVVLVALGLVALVAVAGLAIDGGRLFTLRRRVQNAADASALAAAQVLARKIVTCSGGSVADDNEVAIEMVKLARLNGFPYDAPNVEIAGWYTDASGARIAVDQTAGYGFRIPTGATGIHVSLTVREPTTFMRVVGQTEITANAETTVMIGPLRTLDNQPILPIALSDEVLRKVSVGQPITLFDEETYCRGEPCDEDVSEALHGWLNLSFIYNAQLNGGSLDRAFTTNVGANGCTFNGDGSINVGGTGLKGWAGDGCAYPLPVFAGQAGTLDGDWIHGEPGMRVSALRAIRDGHTLGSQVVVPIFDITYSKNEMDAAFSDPEGTGGKWPSGGGGRNNKFFHVIGFATAELVEIQDKPEKGPEDAEAEDTEKDKEKHSITAVLRHVDYALPYDVNAASGTGIRQACLSDDGILMGFSIWE